MLIILGGLPATGKTTIAKALATQCNGTYLRIDTIEQTLKQHNAFANDVGAMGYQVAYALAEESLKLGQLVIADSVNPIAITRNAWRAVANNALAAFIEVEVICSDQTEHKRRAEHRQLDIAGLTPPTWEAIVEREYEPWLEATLRIDTATISVTDAVSIIAAQIKQFKD